MSRASNRAFYILVTYDEIARILRTADEKSLIMLDELCSGTDPVEGSALAVSILDEFRKRDCK